MGGEAAQTRQCDDGDAADSLGSLILSLMHHLHHVGLPQRCLNNMFRKAQPRHHLKPPELLVQLQLSTSCSRVTHLAVATNAVRLD